MPLNQECSLKAFNDNVSELIDAGRDQKQATAIAIRTLKKSCGVDPKNTTRMAPKEIVMKSESYVKESDMLISSKLREMLGGLKSFAGVTDDQFLNLEKILKKIGLGDTVKSGAIAHVFKYLDAGLTFPASLEFFRSTISDDPDGAMASLRRGGVLSGKNVPSYQAKRNVKMTPEEIDAIANKQLKNLVVVDLKGSFMFAITKWILKNGVKMKIESFNRKMVGCVAESLMNTSL